MAFFHMPGVTTAMGVKATFRGGDVFIKQSDNGLLGVIGVDLETRPGRYRLNITTPDDSIQKMITVYDGGFRVERIRLPKSKVDLSKSVLKRVTRESGRVEKVWRNPSETPLWEGLFIIPSDGEYKNNFGTRRYLNGKARSPHSGVDIS
ncbi:MAG: hypothetical protein V3T30_01395, partial [Thermodesulfobacteriota bacterium]